MPEEILLRVVRGTPYCECPSIMGSTKDPQLGTWHQGVWYQCGHGSTVSVIPARLVDCEHCQGTGNGEEAIEETEAGDLVFTDCPFCLGTGKRLAPLTI